MVKIKNINVNSENHELKKQRKRNIEKLAKLRLENHQCKTELKQLKLKHSQDMEAILAENKKLIADNQNLVK